MVVMEQPFSHDPVGMEISAGVQFGQGKLRRPLDSVTCALIE